MNKSTMAVRGAVHVEYTLMVSIVGVVMIGSIDLFSSRLANLFLRSNSHASLGSGIGGDSDLIFNAEIDGSPSHNDGSGGVGSITGGTDQVVQFTSDVDPRSDSDSDVEVGTGEP